MAPDLEHCCSDEICSREDEPFTLTIKRAPSVFLGIRALVVVPGTWCRFFSLCCQTEECHEELETVKAIYPSSDLGGVIEAALLNKRGEPGL